MREDLEFQAPQLFLNIFLQAVQPDAENQQSSDENENRSNTTIQPLCVYSISGQKYHVITALNTEYDELVARPMLTTEQQRINQPD